MPASLATLLTLAGVLYLLIRDARGGEARGPALWLPVMWLSITGSRFVSQWLASDDRSALETFVEGSPIDAAYFGTLILAGMLVLLRREIRIGAVIRANPWIAALALFGLISVVWSDEPTIALRRWIKTLGHPVMALIVLTEPDPKAALRTVLKRCAFIFLPVSLLFIKYLPEYGRGYDPWTGHATYNGIGLTKNGLGFICMISGLVFVWDVLAVRAEQAGTRLVDRLVSMALLALAVWLLLVSDSMTSLATLTVGVAVMLFVATPLVPKRHFVTFFLISLLSLWGLQVSFDLYNSVVALLGRNPTLTDRTSVWTDLLAMQQRPLIGYGFESFWLGSRLDRLWDKWWWHPTSAHNGYIETYLNLGLIGVLLMIGMLLSTLRRIALRLQTDLDLARMQLAVFVAIVLFSYTETAFRGVSFIWTVYHLIALDVPRPRALRATYRESLA